jgi:hypothetical protein
VLPPRAVLLAAVCFLLFGCAQKPLVEKPVAATASGPIVIDENKLWKREYEPDEEKALANSTTDFSLDNILLLAKLSQVHYNSMIAAPDQIELRKHTGQGEVVSRVALQSYIKAKLPPTDPLYAQLLRRLALFEEKEGKFADAQQHMKQVIAAPVKPPPSRKEIFSMKMDLARMYMDGRTDDKAAAALLDELLAEAKKDPTITDAHIILYDVWVKAQDRVNGDPKKVEAMRKLSKRLKHERAVELERETNDTLKDMH